MLDSIFLLPEAFDQKMWIKMAVLGCCVLFVAYFLMLILLNSVYRNTGNPRELDIALSRFWSVLWTLGLLQAFAILMLSWNLGEAGREVMWTPPFYLRLIPEMLLSVILFAALFAIRNDIKSALKQ